MQAATEWCNQVFDLHDRGLTPGEIRYIMLLEHGGEGYEEGNGVIDEIVRNVPRKNLEQIVQPVEASDRRPIPAPTS